MPGVISNEFTGLPIDQLIGAPLIAAADAQQSLARSTQEFITKIGFEGVEVKDGQPIDGTGKVRMVTFNYDGVDEKGETQEMELKVPFLAMVNVPSLKVENVDITFNMEVKSAIQDTSSTKVDVNGQASYSGWGAKVSVSGSVSSMKESTRSTDTAAKYTINVKAADPGMPEGLSRVLDILSAATKAAPKEKKNVVNGEAGQMGATGVAGPTGS